jgi:ferredoxin--NADP+ reductase
MNDRRTTGSPAPRVAVVGSGPSGCYTAQFLRKAWSDAEIVVLDRLETPYGLIRYGVAPDHVGTKGIARQFDRLFTRGGVRFSGGVEVGRDVTLEELRAAYDVVVLATGLPADRVVAGFHDESGRRTHDGVYGSGELTRMVNGHPDRRAADVHLGTSCVVVGHGNVALDLVRLVLTPPGDLVEFGVPQDAVVALGEGSVRRLSVVGRSGPAGAKFDAAAVRELGRLPDVRFTSDADAGESAVGELVAASPTEAGRQVDFHFGWTPERLEGSGRVERAVFTSPLDTGRTLVLQTDSVLTAIGFTEGADHALRRDLLQGEHSDLATGRLGEGLYCVGWLRRGPVGTIPANRTDARLVSDAIIADVEARRRSSAA